MTKKPLTKSIPVRKAKPGGSRRSGVHIRISDHVHLAARELAAARRVSMQAIYEAAVSAYLRPDAQDHRDVMIGRQLNRLSRVVETVDWNTKLLIAMLRYQIELDLSFLPEPVTDEDRRSVSEKGARRFDRFEQWLVRHLVEPENFYQHLQREVAPVEPRRDEGEDEFVGS